MPKRGFISITVEKKYEDEMKLYYKKLKVKELERNLAKVRSSLK